MSSTLNHHYPTIQGEHEAESDFEVEFEDETESEFEAESEWELEDEFEDEDEAEFDFEVEAGRAAGAEGESEAFVNPVRRIYPDAELMAHLSTQAARSASDAEAEAFIGALVPLAARLVPRAAQVVVRHAPTLIRGLTQVTGQLRRNPTARRFVVAVPVILQRTVQSLGDHAAAGRTIDGELVLRTLATITRRVLGGSRRRNTAVRAVRTFDRRYHRRQRGPVRPPVRGAAHRGRRRR